MKLVGGLVGKALEKRAAKRAGYGSVAEARAAANSERFDRNRLPGTCPTCGWDGGWESRSGLALFVVGLGMLSWGLLLTLTIIFAFWGIPMMVIGFTMMIGSPAANVGPRCQRCKTPWKPGEAGAPPRPGRKVFRAR